MYALMCIIHTALTPHLEAASFDLQNLFAVFNSVAALCLCLLYCVLADG